MAEDLFDRFQVIDTDTHVTEPRDLWTSRVASKWGDKIPHIERMGNMDVWMVGSQPVGAPGAYSIAGYDGTIPDFPPTYEDIPQAAAFDARARLAHMDREGIWVQVLYPNVGGFGSGTFRKLGDPELVLDCVRGYNDFLVEWCSADSDRLKGVAAMPFWDIDASVKEIQRCADLGYKAGDFPLTEKAAAETLAIPVFSELTEEQQRCVVDVIAEFFGA